MKRTIKNISAFLFLLSVSVGFGQKVYSFDYALSYNFQNEKGERAKKRLYLTNSANNDYYVSGNYLDNNRIQLTFVDENGIRGELLIDRDKFLEKDTLEIKCRNVKYSPPLTAAEKAQFKVFMKPDTIIDGTAHKRYSVKRLGRIVGPNYHYGESDIILRNGAESHQPLFYSAYIPAELKPQADGIPREVFLRNVYLNRHEYIFKYLSHTKIKKFIIIPEKCDYTDSEKQKGAPVYIRD